MPTYSDSEMRAIMGRALQIDSGRSERFTPEQLRTIATELGISTQALEVAMYEADSGARSMRVAPDAAAAPRRWTGVAIAVGALLIAALGFGFMERRVMPRQDSPVRAAEVERAARATTKFAPANPAPTASPESPATPVPKATKKIRQ